MRTMDIVQILFYVLILTVLAIPLGRYMAKVFSQENTWVDPLFRPLEKLIYRLTGTDEQSEMDWKSYAGALLIFNFCGFFVLFLLQLLQKYLPLNPQGFGAVSPDLAFNTAASFVTNTNWQAYSGESTMSYMVQMAGFTVQNFVSAATGIVVVIALTRGLARKTASTIGNFWVDLTRSILWILLPLSVIGALVLTQQGVIQNFSSYLHLATLDGGKQTLAMGPVASQEAIKMFGTNGGGFFNANSAHPFENPTPLSNFLEMLFILLIPAALPFTFGHMVGNPKQGRVIFVTMLVLFLIFVGATYSSEMYGNPNVTALGISGPSAMEGKEVRFGVANSALFATITTAASCGAVNAMHDSLTPLGGMIPMLQMMLGEVVFGGVGAGLYGMLIFVILTVFIVGLMVGRTPEYLGKKIESWEIKMATIAILVPAVTILVGSALASVTKAGTSSILNPGPHGLSEILYAFTSAGANNGSAFAGLNANTPFYNIAIGIAILLGRFGIILPVLAIAGGMVKKKAIPEGPGTFQTTGLLFGGLLAGIVIIVSALTFFPALALGPIVEHLIMIGK
ncbi:K+-transporting ATPase, KdpA [Desulfosporosinus acidiphilus SJ4]|uniref:Potassium-transporting ATPase potassium-binding subunit n=1 Tax=Desulfosporosinus acidiphilus (strain DSM 22704 / JCM 16185 / SJ4) TaxID=646529 RepID=I4D2C5_DESAJ|nr:potassium-transporting ATPase subunit KdpA [Desulfosporosinus acidiphilus]AFM39949.1 K+-transporting ATPase, KdpA [Desulfosporosinus acidiphilus SJ4]